MKPKVLNTFLLAHALSFLATGMLPGNTFTGAVSTDWHTPDNWSWMVVPQGFQGAGIHGNRTATISSAQASLYGLQIGASTEGGSGTLNVLNQSLTIGYQLMVGSAGWQGTLNVASGGFVNSQGSIFIGHDANSTGIVNVSGAGSNFGISHAYSGFHLGTYGHGSLTIQDGGLVNTYVGNVVGANAGSSGEVTVTGAGSVWNPGSLKLGASGSGNLLVEAGAVVGSIGYSNGNCDIGFNAGGIGVATITGSGSQWSLLTLSVGSSGQGTLLVEAGGKVLLGDHLRIGQYSGSTGEVTVRGEHSLLESTGYEFRVGNQGNGTLNIEDGALVRLNRTDGGSYVGNYGGTGTVNVTGTGSQWLTSTLFMSAESTLNVLNGGAVISSRAFIGYNGDAEVRVSGSGPGLGEASLWNIESDFNLGYYDNGMLTVEAGGRVTAPSVLLAYYSGAQGTIHLNGTAGSRGVLETGYLFENNGTIHFDGGILRATGNQSNFLQNFETGDVQILSGGAFIDTQAFNVGITQVLQGAGGLTKQGTGTLTLTGSQEYAGGTTVQAGTLAIQGSLSPNGHVTVAEGATLTTTGGMTVASGFSLGGSGVISGSSTILGNHSPGNSPGILTHDDLSYGNGATVTWDLIGNSTTGRGTLHDGINVTDTLTFTGTTLLELVFNAPNGVSWLDPFWSIDQQWLVYDVGGSTSGFGNLSVEVENWQDGYGTLFNTARAGSYFDVLLDGNGRDVWLRFNAIPEPSRALLLLAGLLGASLRRRRAKRGDFSGCLND